MFYDELIKFMKKEGKNIGDIEFVQSYSYNDDNDVIFHEIATEDFIQTIKDIKNLNISDTIKIVGNGWWIATDTDEGYFEIYEIPKRPEKKINLAKELLLNPSKKAGIILGIECDDEDMF